MARAPKSRPDVRRRNVLAAIATAVTGLLLGAGSFGIFGTFSAFGVPGAVSAATVAHAHPIQATASGACRPAITHVSPFPPGKSPDITISGTCFGADGAFADGDSEHFRISDLGPKGTMKEFQLMLTGAIPPQPQVWNACANVDDKLNSGREDTVTCTVPTWTNTRVTMRSFGQGYGTLNWEVKVGDKVVVQIWNAKTLAGPAVYLTTVAK